MSETCPDNSCIYRRLFRALRDEANSSGITLSKDWGGNSLTVGLRGGHTHIGDEAYTDDQLCGELLQLLTRGRGLSIVANKPRRAT